MTRRRRVPVVLQTTLADCGAACLAMMLGYHGYAATLREVRGRLGASRDGLSALALIGAAGQYGLTARAYSVAPADLERLPPVIVHRDLNHFLVVERWAPHAVEVVDPAAGRRRMTSEEFDAGFTGVVLLLEPGPEFRPRKAEPCGRPWRRRLLSAVLVRHRGLWLQVLLAPLGLLWLGAWRVLDGSLSVGAMLGLAALATASLAPLSTLAGSLQLLQTASAHLERLLDIVETETEDAGRLDRPAPSLRGGSRYAASASATIRGRPGSCATSRSPSRPGRRSRSSAAPAPARVRSPGSSSACTRRPRDRSSTTVHRPPSCICRRCAASSASSRRSHPCSPAPSGRTSPSATPARRWSR